MILGRSVLGDYYGSKYEFHPQKDENTIRGGKDGSAAREPAQCRQLKRMGVDADIFFDNDENHFIMVNRRADMMKFLKRRMNLE